MRATYAAMLHLAENLGGKLEAIDAANGGSLDVSAVGEAVRDVLAQASGERPRRLVVVAPLSPLRKNLPRRSAEIF